MLIEIPDWSVWNPRTDIKQPSWFRENNDLLTNEVFTDATISQRYMWSVVRAERNKARKDVFKLNVRLVSTYLGMTEAHVRGDVMWLARNKLVRVHGLEVVRADDADGCTYVQAPIVAVGGGPVDPTAIRPGPVRDPAGPRTDHDAIRPAPGGPIPAPEGGIPDAPQTTASPVGTPPEPVGAQARSGSGRITNGSGRDPAGSRSLRDETRHDGTREREKTRARVEPPTAGLGLEDGDATAAPRGRRTTSWPPGEPFAKALANLAATPAYAAVFDTPHEIRTLKAHAERHSLTVAELEEVTWQLRCWADGPSAKEIKSPRGTLATFVGTYARKRPAKGAPSTAPGSADEPLATENDPW